MRKLNSSLALVVSAGLFPVHGFALDLVSAIRDVDSTHPQIKIKREELFAAESELSFAKQQFLPTFSLISNRSNNESSKQFFVTRVQQPLFAGGRLIAGVDRAEARIQEARSLLDATRRDLMIKTISTFHESLKQRERIKIAEQNVKAHQELLESIGRRVAAEVSPRSDLMITSSRLSQAETERSQVLLALERATYSLRELLDREPPPIEPPAPREALNLELTQALSEAESYSPEVKRFRAQESVASSEVSIQRANALPNVFVRYENFSKDRDAGVVREQTYIGVEFVPGAGVSVAQQISAGEKRRLASIEARRNAEKETRERVRAIWADWLSLQTQLVSARSYVESANSVKESFVRQFTIGRKTWLEVLNATREAFQAELVRTEIDWNLKITRFRLEIEIGRLTPDTLN